MSELLMQRGVKPWLWPDFIFDNVNSGKEQKRNLHILHGVTKTVRIYPAMSHTMHILSRTCVCVCVCVGGGGGGGMGWEVDGRGRFRMILNCICTQKYVLLCERDTV